MKIPQSKSELQALIKRCGSRRAAMQALGMVPVQFYRLVHKFGLSINKRWADYGRLAADGKPTSKRVPVKRAKATARRIKRSGIPKAEKISTDSNKVDIDA